MVPHADEGLGFLADAADFGDGVEDALKEGLVGLDAGEDESGSGFAAGAVDAGFDEGVQGVEGGVVYTAGDDVVFECGRWRRGR